MNASPVRNEGLAPFFPGGSSSEGVPSDSRAEKKDPVLRVRPNKKLSLYYFFFLSIHLCIMYKKRLLDLLDVCVGG